MLVTKLLLVAIDFHSMEINTVKVNSLQQVFGEEPNISTWILGLFVD